VFTAFFPLAVISKVVPFASFLIVTHPFLLSQPMATGISFFSKTADKSPKDAVPFFLEIIISARFSGSPSFTNH